MSMACNLWVFGLYCYIMEEKLELKSYKIGTGKPLICVPVVGRQKEEILGEAKEIVRQGAAILEWRMDWYSQISDWECTQEVLQELAALCKNTIVLCTFRTKQQGGEREISEQEYCALLSGIAKCGCADLVDVEPAGLSDPEGVVAGLHQQGIAVLASQHYFSHTPKAVDIEGDLCRMKELGADIGKVAVMPQQNTDVLRLMEATMHVKGRYPDYPVVTMAMGRMGLLSRISGQIFGSCITFGTLGKASAPGQLPMAEVAAILDRIAESLEYKDET